MTPTVLRALFSHWRRNKLQLFTLLAGLALATALWSGVQAINAEARASYDAAAATLGEGQFDQIVRADGEPIAQADYIALRRAGWLVSPVVEGRLNGQRLVGLDPLTAPGGLGPVTLEEGSDVSAFVTGAGQVFAQAATFAALGPTEATQVISPDVAPGTILTDIGVAQRLLGAEGQVQRLLVAPDQPLGQPSLDEITDGLVRQVAQGGSDVGRLTDSFHLNLTAFGFLSFAVGIFIVNGAIGLAFEQRRSVVRTMRALGVPLNWLILLMCFELLLFAVIAGAIGVALGYVIAASLLPDVAATLRGLYGADVGGTLQIRPAWWLSGMAIAVGGTALAAGAALWKLARMPLLAAAQPRAWALSGGKALFWQAGAAVGLLLMSVLLGVFASGIAAGFGLLASLLIGAALALPLILSAILSVARKLARGPVAQWFWADTRQQLPGLSLALMALLLAMSANVGVSTMVSSFRLTFVGFLDQVLNAELYVYTADEAETATFLQVAEPLANAILPLMSTDRSIASLPAELFSARDEQTYRDNWTFLQSVSQPWDVLARGEGVLINEQLFRRADLALGAMVEVAEGVTLPVIGIYGDYGNPIGQAIITEELFQTLYPEVQPTRFGVRIPAEEVQSLRTALKEAGLADANMIDQAGIKAFSLEVFDRTFTVTTALNILTLAVAGFAILMSLLTLAALRVPQLAPIWALGITRRQLGFYELCRAMLLAVLTAAVALPLGLALAWVLLSVINVEAFGWKLPMFVFPAEYLRLGLFALVAACIASAWPAIRLARTPPAHLLKVFSNER